GHRMSAPSRRRRRHMPSCYNHSSAPTVRSFDRARLARGFRRDATSVEELVDHCEELLLVVDVRVAPAIQELLLLCMCYRCGQGGAAVAAIQALDDENRSIDRPGAGYDLRYAPVLDGRGFRARLEAATDFPQPGSGQRPQRPVRCRR